MDPIKLLPLDPAYPRRLCHLEEPPEITVSGPLDDARRIVAIVGSREAKAEALHFVYELAYHLAKAGIVVASGGAVGVDRNAHEGAMAADGSTWCVACFGRGAPYPTRNEDLFEQIEGTPGGRMIWPFPDGAPKTDESPRARNGVLVALAECVVVVQAAFRSGSRNAVSWARYLGRRTFVIPGSPWDHDYTGSLMEIMAGGVEVLCSIDHLFDTLGLPPPDHTDPKARRSGMPPPVIRARPRRRSRQTYSEPPRIPVEKDTWTDDEKLVFSKLSLAPIQQDTIVDRTGLPTSSTLTALLTLSLKDVVVEGPDGFFRRRIAL